MRLSSITVIYICRRAKAINMSEEVLCSYLTTFKTSMFITRVLVGKMESNLRFKSYVYSMFVRKTE